MFYLRVRDDDGNLNGIDIVRLKEKLGTRQLPTAELLLESTAHRVSSPITQATEKDDLKLFCLVLDF